MNRVVECVGAALISLSSATIAATTYTYTGSNFTGFSSPAGSYDPTDRVTGSFTLGTPLPPNLPLTDISAQVLNYSFSDNVQTRTNNNSEICATNNYGFLVAPMPAERSMLGASRCAPRSPTRASK